MARYTVSADTIEELLSSVAHLAGETTEEAAEGKPTRGRRKKSEAPDPVVPTAGPAAADPTPGPGAAFNPGATAAADPTPGPGPGAAFNPGATAGPGAAAFNPGATAGPSETFVKVKAHLEAMAAAHGVNNVYDWVNKVIGGQPATPEQVRDAVLPTLSDAQLQDIYAKSGGK